MLFSMHFVDLRQALRRRLAFTTAFSDTDIKQDQRTHVLSGKVPFGNFAHSAFCCFGYLTEGTFCSTLSLSSSREIIPKSWRYIKFDPSLHFRTEVPSASTSPKGKRMYLLHVRGNVCRVTSRYTKEFTYETTIHDHYIQIPQHCPHK